MSSTLYCYICDVETLKRKSVFGIRTRHSRLPIAELLKKIQNSDIRPRDGSNICVLCDDCVDEINIYDEACQLAERVEKQLKETLARTEKRYENGTDPIKIFETEQMEVSRDSKEAALNLNCVAADQFDLDEMNGVSLDLDDNNDTCSANMSEPENEVESEEEDFDSDDSFVWPKSSALKRKREKEKGKENVKKKQHIFKCIDCPAEYRDKYEMQVISIFGLRISNLLECKCILFQLHVASHKTNFQVRCGICYMRITRGRESMEHENYHLNRLDLQCIFCDEIFEKKGDLVFHVETHVSSTTTIHAKLHCNFDCPLFRPYASLFHAEW